MTVEDVRTYVNQKFSSLTNEVSFYAMIFKKYTVTYLDENQSVIKTDEVLFSGQVPSYTIEQPYSPKNPDQKFE